MSVGIFVLPAIESNSPLRNANNIVPSNKQTTNTSNEVYPMLKTQKTFSPLECRLCNNCNCRYFFIYDQLYKSGLKIRIKDCVRLQKCKG